MYFLKDKRIWLIAVAVTIVLLMLLTADALIFNSNKRVLFEGVIVEFHGFLFDLLFFGLVISIYDAVSNRRLTLRRLIEELDDFRGWSEKTAEKRIRGIIKRLLANDFTELDLRNCYLPNSTNFGTEEMKGWVFRKTSLMNSNFNEVTFVKCNFRWAELEGTQFDSCRFVECDFSHAQLFDVKFENCELKDVKFEAARVKKGFLKSIENASNTSVIDTLKIYKEVEFNKGLEGIKSYYLELN